ncbi:hypothetical protein DFJ74DRAFT_675103 [Hyaloraphidium curvatum]|nr:hypothetical protein DFJ74DRAFT_675103 [Hyaloraphidium curvatum]
MHHARHPRFRMGPLGRNLLLHRRGHLLLQPLPRLLPRLQRDQLLRPPPPLRPGSSRLVHRLRRPRDHRGPVHGVDHRRHPRRRLRAPAGVGRRVLALHGVQAARGGAAAPLVPPLPQGPAPRRRILGPLGPDRRRRRDGHGHRRLARGVHRADGPGGQAVGAHQRLPAQHARDRHPRRRIVLGAVRGQPARRSGEGGGTRGRGGAADVPRGAGEAQARVQGREAAEEAGRGRGPGNGIGAARYRGAVLDSLQRHLHAVRRHILQGRRRHRHRRLLLLRRHELALPRVPPRPGRGQARTRRRLRGPAARLVPLVRVVARGRQERELHRERGRVHGLRAALRAGRHPLVLVEAHPRIQPGVVRPLLP